MLAINVDMPRLTISMLLRMQVVVQALLNANAVNKGFDLVSKDEGDGSPTTDFAALFEQTQPGL